MKVLDGIFIYIKKKTVQNLYNVNFHFFKSEYYVLDKQREEVKKTSNQ